MSTEKASVRLVQAVAPIEVKGGLPTQVDGAVEALLKDPHPNGLACAR